MILLHLNLILNKIMLCGCGGQLDFNIKFPLLHLLQFLSNLKSTIYMLQRSICLRKCGSKDDEDNIIMCDECNDGYHLACLGLTTLPEEDEWYCPQAGF